MGASDNRKTDNVQDALGKVIAIKTMFGQLSNEPP